LSTYRVPFDDLPWQAGPGGLLFKTHRFGASQLRLMEFTPQLVHPQWCTTGHVGYVVEGDVEIEFVGHTVRYRAGDGVVIPAGQADAHRPHALSSRVRFVFVEDLSAPVPARASAPESNDAK
jgi:quercetin dioxygenase-like cupin family protein